MNFRCAAVRIRSIIQDYRTFWYSRVTPPGVSTTKSVNNGSIFREITFSFDEAAPLFSKAVSSRPDRGFRCAPLLRPCTSYALIACVLRVSFAEEQLTIEGRQSIIMIAPASYQWLVPAMNEVVVVPIHHHPTAWLPFRQMRSSLIHRNRKAEPIFLHTRNH